MPGGVLHYQNDFLSDDVNKYLKKFDFRIATLESAIGDNLSFDQVKMNDRMNIIFSKDSDVQKLVDLNINIVSLANNHIFDLGIEGFINTVDLLKKYKINYCGAGLDIHEASKPAIIKFRGKNIAIFSYCQHGSKYIGHVPIATETHFGINPLNIDKVLDDVKKAKLIYDYVFVMPHWGVEYTYLPTLEMKKIAYEIIKAGADGVFGSHPHQIQPMISYLNKPIVFSMGNFLFPDFYMYPPRPIWYPDKNFDLDSIEDVVGYPFPIKSPMKQIWNLRSRVGMLVEINIEKALSANYKLTFLNKNNIITLYNKGVIRKQYRLLIYGLLIKLPFYSMIYYIYNSKFNLFRRTLNFVRRKLNV